MRKATVAAGLVLGCLWAVRAEVDFVLTARLSPTGEIVRVCASNAADRTVDDVPGRRTVNCRFDGRSPIRAVRIVERTASDGARRCRLSAEISDGWCLEELEYPIVRIAPGKDLGQGDLRIVLGTSKGGVYVNPLKEKVGWTWKARDPESMVAGFAAAYTAEKGFYFAAEDVGFDVKSIVFTRDDKGLLLSHQIECWATGRFDMTYDVVMSDVVRDGADLRWEDLAERYRNWNDRQSWMKTRTVNRPDLPRWMKEGPSMVRFSRQWLEAPEEISAFLRWWRGTFGAGDVLAALWGWEKVGTWWGPDYFPCHPDDETFRRETAAMRKAGFRAFTWPSGYNWCKCIGRRPDGSYDVDYRQTFVREAIGHLAMTREGLPFHQDAFWLRDGALTSVCGGDVWTRSWWDGIVRALGERGSEAVQIDQTVGGRLRECWDPRHGHALGRGSWQREVFLEQLKSMRTALKSVQVDGVIGVEEPNARFMGIVGLQDYRDLESDADEQAGVFSYLYHGYVPIFQSNPPRDEIAELAYMAAEGQMPFFKPLRSDLLPQRPLLENGGFEDLVDSVRGPAAWERHIPGRAHWTGMDPKADPWNYSGWSNQGWLGVGVNLDEREVHGGRVSLRLEPVAGKYWRMCPRVLAVSQTIGGIPAGEYELSAWVKTAQCAAGGEGALLFGTRRGGEMSRLTFPTVASGWRRLATKVTVGDELRLIVRATPGYRGWIDDICMRDADGRVVQTQADSLYVRFMKRWVSLFRGEGLDFMANGVRIRSPVLSCSTVRSGGRLVPSVRHAAYRSADGREALVLANGTETRQTCSCSWQGRRQTFVLEPADILIQRAE